MSQQSDAEPQAAREKIVRVLGRYGTAQSGRLTIANSILAALAQSDAEPVATVTFWYRNYRGEISRRVAAILGLRWGSSEYHKEPQWLLRGFDLEKEAEREFAVKDMAPTRDALAQSDAEPDASAGLIAALNAVFSWARQRCPCENDMPAICPLCDADVTKDTCKAVPGTFPPRLLKQMQDALRAADRSGK